MAASIPFGCRNRTGECHRQDHGAGGVGTDPDDLRLVVVHDRDNGLEPAVMVAYVAGEALLPNNQITAAITILKDNAA